MPYIIITYAVMKLIDSREPKYLLPAPYQSSITIIIIIIAIATILLRKCWKCSSIILHYQHRPASIMRPSSCVSYYTPADAAENYIGFARRAVAGISISCAAENIDVGLSVPGHCRAATLH